MSEEDVQRGTDLAARLMPWTPAIGIFALLLGGVIGAALRGRWVETGCDVLVSRVTIERGMEVESPYLFQVSYRYSWRGQVLVGRAYQWEYHGDDLIAEADRRRRAYPAQARTVCYVNPAEPGQSQLLRPSLRAELAPLLGGFGWLLITFAPVGLFVIRCLFGGESSEGQGTRVGRLALWALKLTFVTGGLAGFAFFAAGVAKNVAARSWVRTPCRVIHSEVRKSTSNGGEAHFTAYWPDVAFEYVVNGQTFRSNRYNFTDRATPWFYGKRAIVERYAPKQPATCYVNPLDPSEAVLMRGWQASTWFGFWPLVVAVLGLRSLMKPNAAAGEQGARGEPDVAREERIGTMIAAAVAGFSTQLVLVLGADLVRDVRLGRADVFEWAAVVVVGFFMVTSTIAFSRGVLGRTVEEGGAGEAG